MISLGKNIRQPNDPLEKIPLKTLADKIRNPHQKLIDYILQLRKIITIDTKRYRELKTSLPYVVAATFNPPFRKIENFASTQYFILDIDHLSDKEIDIEYLAKKFGEDPRVALLFRSPSNDGLKLFFKTAEPFYDPGKYSLFYKTFASAFASEYSVSQVVDKKTSDVSRACFVSYDPLALYNENPEDIKINKYVDFDEQLQVMELEELFRESEKEHQKQPSASETDIRSQDLDSEIIRSIRERLNPKLAVKREKKIIVPEALETIIELVTTNLREYGFEVEDIVNINYGKQFRMKINHLRAEINIFYGKKGFSVVKSTKSGMNADLVDAAYDIIASVIL
jgi:hypothetical protein